MMKKVWIRGTLVCLTVLTFVAGFTTDTAAVTINFPKNARRFLTTFSRAFDECTSPTLTVTDPPHLPATGCVAANATTQDLSAFPMSIAKLIVKSNGKIVLFGGGFNPGARVQVELKLRVTKSGTPNVTFEDVTVTCDGNPQFTAYATKKIIGHDTLANCLGPSLSGLAGPDANIEILEANLIDVDTGEYFGTPGTTRKKTGFPHFSRGLNVTMVQAGDECTAGNLTIPVSGTGLPSAGCGWEHTITDDTVNFKTMRLKIRDNGKIILHATGVQLGDAVRMRMVVRATVNSVDTNSGLETVTFEDLVASCPTAYAFLSSSAGNVDCGNCAGIGQTTTIAACLATNLINGDVSGIGYGNLEIVDVSVVNANGHCVGGPHNGNGCTIDANCDGGLCDAERVVAVPGIRN
jgi:hypothetical protein